ncbi:MAG: 23S rRNA (adenine(2503)-C(2))-methyltransferase RlmN [Christensenellales bacterium]|jgi:23S rRNA (adenine2503-C2)-methyltransferase
MIDLLSLSLDELKEEIKSAGLPPFRATQIYSWLMKGASFEGMKNLPLTLRESLSERYKAGSVSILETFSSEIDGTKKLLFALDDGNVVEGVFMRHSYGNTLCISSQVGCAMGCAFCASTIGGAERDITAAEMLHMVLLVNAIADGGERRGVTNIVIMGSGEPLLNYDNVIKFLRLVSAPGGINISPRNISLSTCGIIPAIYKLMEENLPITLAISLHAATDDIRSQIMPVNRQYPIKELLGACVEYTKRTKRRIVFEYALIDGLNSSEDDAKALGMLLRGIMCHVNLISLNKVEESPLLPAGKAKTLRFLRTLEQMGISATTRRSMGGDIEGACGQLRRSFLKEQGE